MLQKPNQRVLIFDSGVGGLSVYQEIYHLLPQLEYVYLFDNQAYPYGELPADTLISRATKLISKIVQDKNIDLVVIACNTASTIVLPALRKLLTIPVVGVVPAIKPASLLTDKAVGLIATPATVTREYTQELIAHFAADKHVEKLGSTRLVSIAEEKLRGKAVDIDELRTILSPLIGKVDVAVLGCTHFPLLKTEIQMVLGGAVKLVDSGEAIARRVQDLLKIETFQEQNSHAPFPIYSSAPPWNEDALNRTVTSLGFGPIQNYPLQSV